MPRPGRRITPHKERIAAALERKEWLTAATIASRANVAPRTARLHLSEMVKAREAELRETWPALSYRLSA